MRVRLRVHLRDEKKNETKLNKKFREGIWKILNDKLTSFHHVGILNLNVAKGKLFF